MTTRAEEPARPGTHAFLIDPRTDVVHLVNLDTGRAECSASWQAPPLEWAFSMKAKQDKVCAACMGIAQALKALGNLRLEGLQLHPDR